MTTSQASQTDRPDIAVIAAHNDAFRKLACLGTSPDIAIRGRMHVTRSLAEAEDGFMDEAVKATGEFDVFEPENDPDGCHDFGAVDIRGQKVRRELHPLEIGRDRFGDGLGEQGLTQTGHIFDQQMSTRNQRRDGLTNDGFLADESA